MRLTKGMYGNEFSPASKLFGLCCGQRRGSDKIGHNSGWYNGEGEKLGWGDLNEKDLKRIAKGLESVELFVVLREVDSFWKFVTQHGIIGSMCVTAPTHDAPGKEYIAEHCYILVRRDLVCKVSDYAKDTELGVI